MRWRNVQVFGWRAFRPKLLSMFLMIIMVMLAGAVWWYFSTDHEIIIAPEVQRIIEPVEFLPVVNVSVEKETFTEEDEDADFYKVNTYFFSSSCLFDYNKNMDDLSDLKNQRARLVDNENVDKESQLARVDRLLGLLRAELRDLILQCSL